MKLDDLTNKDLLFIPSITNEKTFRLVNHQPFTIIVDNSKANTGNINIDRPHFFCFALNKEEAIGKMMLSDFEHKHKTIVEIGNF